MMGYKEKYLYVCLGLPPDSTPCWFILRPTLDAATGKAVNRAYLIPSFPSQPIEGSIVVALDYGIYIIGGLVNGKRTQGVLLLDCRFHKWHYVNSMRVARSSAAAHVVDGKIYVLGGCKDKKYSDWGEVFDPKTQTWADLPMPAEEDDDPDSDPKISLIQDSVVIEDRMYVVDSWKRSFYYLPRECKWGRGNVDSKPLLKRDWCVIDNLLCACGNDECIYWCEPKELDRCEPEELDRCEPEGMDWKEVQGLQILEERLRDSRVVHFGGKTTRVWESYKNMHQISENLQDILPGVKLTNFGQHIVFFWNKLRYKSWEIWCAKIS